VEASRKVEKVLLCSRFKTAFGFRSHQSLQSKGLASDPKPGDSG
jgi:hypothetical protein